ncbi:FtsX-like permease family protein, partial [Candidatus Babeliales bacterium]|nr:FtsX-like permease family protein [Candidatus Babeliales bacterium]
LNLAPNDPALLLYQQTQQCSTVIIFDQQPVIIGGIFKTGIDDFDNNVIYCNALLFDQMFDTHDISHIHIKLNDKNFELKAKDLLTTQLQAAVYSWKDLYPTLLSALKLEKWAMFLILLLIVCVASMNIISLIFMYVTQKQKDIFILMTLGLSYHKIRAVFITISLCITVPSTIIGLTLAWVIGLLLQTYPLIKLPDNMYDTQHIPVKLEPSIFCAILIITIIISLLTSLYATSNINRIKFIELLKT